MPKWRDGILRSFVCYPQIIFDRNGPHFRSDAKEVMDFGFQDFQRIITAAAHRCFQEYCGGRERKIHFEKIPTSLIGDDNRFPPRLFFRKTIKEIAHKRFKSCVIRFCHEDDKRIVFRELERLDSKSYAKPNWEITPSSRLPRFAIAFDIGDALRCMIKTGLNLIAYTCNLTDIRAQEFAWARRIITGVLPIDRKLIERNGFLRPESVSFLNPAPRTHKFRLSFWDGRWRVYSAYFGGDIGSFVEFPGISNEPWRTVDCEFSLDSDHVAVEKYSISFPENSQPIEWTNSRLICPSVELISFASKFEVQITQKNLTS